MQKFILISINSPGNRLKKPAVAPKYCHDNVGSLS